MLTPFKVMLGIGPPGLIWPFTLLGTSASESSPSPRSLIPRGAISGRCKPELSQRSVISAKFSQPLSSDQVPTPRPGRPPRPARGIPPGHCPQPMQLPTHICAFCSASRLAMSDCASPNWSNNRLSSAEASARDCAAPGFSLFCILPTACLRHSPTLPYWLPGLTALSTSSSIFFNCSSVRLAFFNWSIIFCSVCSAASAWPLSSCSARSLPNWACCICSCCIALAIACIFSKSISATFKSFRNWSI